MLNNDDRIALAWQNDDQVEDLAVRALRAADAWVLLDEIERVDAVCRLIDALRASVVVPDSEDVLHMTQRIVSDIFVGK